MLQQELTQFALLRISTRAPPIYLMFADGNQLPSDAREGALLIQLKPEHLRSHAAKKQVATSSTPVAIDSAPAQKRQKTVNSDANGEGEGSGKDEKDSKEAKLEPVKDAPAAQSSQRALANGVNSN